mmetsp:Transcript_81363/g.225284  ORF Transcript_81363/g.225284 Transcript_81363/m.225284 type:complete len:265 (+) Transcript_81363:407-1201(+)
MELRSSARVTTPCTVLTSSLPWMTMPAELPLISRSRSASSAVTSSGTSTSGSVQRLRSVLKPPRRRSLARKQPVTKAAVTSGQRTDVEVATRCSSWLPRTSERPPSTSTARWLCWSTFCDTSSAATSSALPSAHWRRFVKGTLSRGMSCKSSAPLISRNSVIARMAGHSPWPSSCIVSYGLSLEPWLPSRQARAPVAALPPDTWLPSSPLPALCPGPASSSQLVLCCPCSCKSARSSARLYLTPSSTCSCSIRWSSMAMMGFEM